MITVTLTNEQARYIKEATKRTLNTDRHQAKWLKKGSRQRNTLERQVKKAAEIQAILKDFGI